ncbi:MAG: DUF3047 domain-containing protein [Gammaproteobacteria bacterium]|nr:DUF3047 domain-containing protein [Gammaproteobacteria bacterium]
MLGDDGFRNWTEQAFVGKTIYTQLSEPDNGKIVRARSHSSASGYFRKLRIDLATTPKLQWRWRIDNTFDNPGERTKAGDDYPARVYVVAKHPTWPWKRLSICYVWSSGNQKGADWPSPYTADVRMVAVRAGRADIGAWQSEERDVRADFLQYLGHEIEAIEAVGIMSDTDDLKTTAESYYGPISFVP